MNGIILYGTCYGSAKQYADELSRRSGLLSVSYEDAGDLSAYDRIVYIGSLYAGGVLGMAVTLGKLADWQSKQIVIATVGLADNENEENTQNIRKGMQRQLPAGMMEHAKLVHLRGGIDYSRLNMKHKVMMGLLYRKAKNLPPEKKTAEVRAMIDTYNQGVDFVDLSRVDELL
ncbi:MAG: hypothetical protein C0413_04535 [Clostridiales bacterium]|nr:hypothetical protein [Clostridiales bacterium]